MVTRNSDNNNNNNDNEDESGVALDRLPKPQFSPLYIGKLDYVTYQVLASSGCLEF